MKTLFIQALNETDKGQVLLSVARESDAVQSRVFALSSSVLAAIPRSPFAYWVPNSVRLLFESCPPLLESGRTAHKGMATSNDLRFVRAAWEVRAAQVGEMWWNYAKGGAFARYFSDVHLLVKWGAHHREVEAAILGRYTYLSSADWLLHTEIPYGKPGLTWSRRSQVGLSMRAMPRGCCFGEKGPAILADHLDVGWLSAHLALVNSLAFGTLVGTQMAFGAYEIGVIQRTPVPDLSSADEAALAALARRAWSRKRGLDTRSDTSHAFVVPALLQVPGDTLATRAAAWEARVREAEAELATIQAEIDERCFALYGISDEDRRSITEGFGGSATGSADDAGEDAGADDDEEAEAETADTATLAAEFVSWAVGATFGRFDVRLATGERELPGEPEPFDPLPVCSPGMLTGTEGLPLGAPPAGYPIGFPADGILVDDPGHPRDLAAAVRSVFDVVFGSRADAAWQEAGDLLDPRGRDVAAWLRSGFFEHHLQRHSKSRRKAPIVWQLGAGRSGIWVYAHRLTRDSLLTIANEIAAPRLATEERRLASLRTQAGSSPSARDRAEIAAAESAVEEARTVLAEVRRVAPLWNPDLDDGIILVSAPLWRLVPHKAWQKELKGRWDELAAGKYDWAHLAMHLWPERVVPKCASDRSLAIAHGLEDVFWAEGPDGKWAKRGRPTRSIEDLVAERTSPAVKAALADLLAAPALAGTGRGRGRSA